MIGFTEEVPIADLTTLAHSHGLWAIDDIGSGALAPGSPSEVGDEPTASHGIAAGADVVLFSGDKLLGGPQCGIMIGHEKAIDRIESDPLMRALRLDKMTLAALEATLRLLLDQDRARERLPLWKMMGTPLSILAARAEKLATAFRFDLGLNAATLASESYLGGGSSPDRSIASMAIAVSPPFPAQLGSASAWSTALRQANPAVVARVHKGSVIFDLRTVSPEQDSDLLDAVQKVCHDRRTGTRSNGPTDLVETVDNVVEVGLIGLEKHDCG